MIIAVLAAAALGATSADTSRLVVRPLRPGGIEVIAASRAVDEERDHSVAEAGAARLAPSLHYSYEEGDPDRRRLASVSLRIDPGPRYRRFRPAETSRWKIWEGRRVEIEASRDRAAMLLEAVEIADGDVRLRRIEAGDAGPATLARNVEVPVGLDVPSWPRLRVLYHVRYVDESAILLRGYDDGDPRRTFVWEVNKNAMSFGPHRPAAPPRRAILAVREAFLDPPDAPPGAGAALVVVVANDGDERAAGGRIEARFGGAAPETDLPPLEPAATAEVRLPLAAAPAFDDVVEIATPTGVARWRRPRSFRVRIDGVEAVGVPREGETIVVEVRLREEAGEEPPVLGLVAAASGETAGVAVTVRAGETSTVRLALAPRPAGLHTVEIRLLRGDAVHAARRGVVDVRPPARPRPAAEIAGPPARGPGGAVEVRGVVSNVGDAPGRFSVTASVAGESFPVAEADLAPGETVPVAFRAPPVAGGWEAGLEARPVGAFGAAAADRRTVYVPHPPLILAGAGETVVPPARVDGRVSPRPPPAGALLRAGPPAVAWRPAGETAPLRLAYDLSGIPRQEVARLSWRGRASASGALLFRPAGARVDLAGETDAVVEIPFAPEVEVALEGGEDDVRFLGPPLPQLVIAVADVDLAALEDVRWETDVGRVAVRFRAAGRSVLRPDRPVGVRLEVDGAVAAEARVEPGTPARLEAAVRPGRRMLRLALARPAAGAPDSEARAALAVPGPGRPSLAFARGPARLGDGRSWAVVEARGAIAYGVVISVGGETLVVDLDAGAPVLVVAETAGRWTIEHPQAPLIRPVVAAEPETSWRLVAVEAGPSLVRWALENAGRARPAPAVVAASAAGRAGPFETGAVLSPPPFEPPVVPAGGTVWAGARAPAGRVLVVAGEALGAVDVPPSSAVPAFVPLRPIVAAETPAPPPETWADIVTVLERAASAAPDVRPAAEAAAALASTIDGASVEERLAARAAADRLGAAADRLAARARDLPWPATASEADAAALADAAAALASTLAPPVLDRDVVRTFAARLGAAVIPLVEAARPSTTLRRDATVPPHR